jgi:hypothetical protein
VFIDTVVSVSLNLNVGCPALASLEIIMLPLAFTFPLVLMFPTAVIIPFDATFPADTLPVNPIDPANVVPVEDTTTTLLTPPTVMAILPLGTGISIDVVPLNILSPAMLPVKLAFPLTLKSPLITTETALAVGPMNDTEELASSV